MTKTKTPKTKKKQIKIRKHKFFGSRNQKGVERGGEENKEDQKKKKKKEEDKEKRKKRKKKKDE